MSQHHDHATFIEAIHGREKIRVVYIGKSDGNRRDRVCSPLDYGLSRRSKSPEPKYHLVDHEGSSGRHPLSLSAEQIVSMAATGEPFDPGEIVTWDVRTSPWSISRDWGHHS